MVPCVGSSRLPVREIVSRSDGADEEAANRDIPAALAAASFAKEFIRPLEQHTPVTEVNYSH